MIWLPLLGSLVFVCVACRRQAIRHGLLFLEELSTTDVCSDDCRVADDLRLPLAVDLENVNTEISGAHTYFEF